MSECVFFVFENEVLACFVDEGTDLCFCVFLQEVEEVEGGLWVDSFFFWKALFLDSNHVWLVKGNKQIS